MDRSKIIVVENKEVSFQLEYFLLKSGKGTCGIEAVKKKDGVTLESQTVFLEDSNADSVYQWIMRLSEAFVTPAVLEEMLREVICLDILKSKEARAAFPLCS